MQRSRAFSADVAPQAPVAPRRSCNCCQTTGLNRRAVGAYSRDVRIPTRFVARKGNPGFGWVVDVLWPDGETEVVKGFAHRTTGRRVEDQRKSLTSFGVLRSTRQQIVFVTKLVLEGCGTMA